MYQIASIFIVSVVSCVKFLMRYIDRTLKICSLQYSSTDDCLFSDLRHDKPYKAILFM